MLKKHTTNRIWITFAVIVLFALLPFLSTTSQTSAAMNEESGNELADFDPDNFDDPTTIDNKWFPLKPGTQFVYEGFTVDENGDENGEEIPHEIVFSVTDLTKEIGGVRTFVFFEK